jgi:hypothetical protein
MGFDVSDANLWREAENAKSARDNHLEQFDEHRARYHGPAYSAKQEEIDDWSEYYPENHYFEYVSLVVPRIIYDNPRVRVATRRSGSQIQVAEAMRHGLNRWVRDVNLRRLLTPVAVDMMFNWGVLLVTQEPRPGMLPAEGWMPEEKVGRPGRSRSPHWPQAYRISQERFYLDPMALNRNECRFMGHTVIRDKKDLLREARENPKSGWDVEAIKALPLMEGVGELYKDYPEHDVERGLVAFEEIWVGEHQLDSKHGPSQGFHGTIFTLARSQGRKAVLSDEKEKRAQSIRAPRGFYGPSSGPFVLFGVYKVPDRVYPLSPLTAVSGQVDDLNAHSIAISESASSYKQLLFVPSPKLQQEVTNGKHQFVFSSAGADKDNFFAFEVGGASPTQIEYFQLSKDRLHSVSGMDDAQRGNVSGRGTATEVAVADEAASARMDFIKEQFADSVEELLTKVAYYMYHDDRTVFPLGQEAANELGMVEPWFLGGDFEKGSGATFEDLELEIEPYSMERTTEVMQQRRMTEIMNFIMNVAPMIPQAPYVRWKEVLNKFGENMNMSNMGELIDIDMAYQFAQLNIQMAGQDPKQSEARLSKDTGNVGVLNRFLGREANRGNGTTQPVSKQVAGPTNGRVVSEAVR